ncbi:unnamed protein product [Diabrotica balteata]|uniref:Receptor-type tyrosine-protein phosphatase N2 n=1 Tax=Diabrotica balteata TaxID=107213 RepID=A0A9P0GXR5_DIABA|nr:unnamed protein product [Diabrotica balteata]
MLWPSNLLKIALLIFVLSINISGSLSEGNVGCLYSDRLCLQEEWCYDDQAFGRCLRTIGDIDEDDLFRYPLERESLHELSHELRRLFALGYRWSHGYTQCRLQAMLYALRHDLTFEPDSCSHLADNDLEGALKVLEGQVELDPQEVAIIRYTPSAEDPHAAYADEVFYPPANSYSQEEIRQKILAPNAVDLDMPDPYADYALVKRTWIPQMKRTLPLQQRFPRSHRKHSRQGPGYDDDLSESELFQNSVAIEDQEQFYPIIKFLSDFHVTPEQIAELLQPENRDKLGLLIEVLLTKTKQKDIQDQLREELEREKETDDVGEQDFNNDDDSMWGPPVDFPESRIYYDEENDGDRENSESGSGYPVNSEFFRERQLRNDNDYEQMNNIEESRPGVYSEGGVVWSEPVNMKENVPQNRLFKNNLNQILQKYKAFKRPERLDVKKPGPPFDSLTEIKENKGKIEPRTKPKDILLPSMMKKEPRGAHPYPDMELQQRRDPDLEYVYVTLKNVLTSWSQGNNIIKNISNILKLDPKVFADGRTFADSVAFKVLPNSRGLNATEVGKLLESMKSKLEQATGVEIIAIGVGNKVNIHLWLWIPTNDIILQTHKRTSVYNKENVEKAVVPEAYPQFYIVVFMVCGVLGAMIVATAILILIRRHIKLKDKLQGLSKPDTEASKDYQDLCRARMATKGQPATDTVHGRITSLSKESEQSPSSRSSTSSWSEEPALHNMDISTGHMVLSYMEDHLKNKDRLEQEWVALCAYVAEPCEVTVATKKDNKENNRYPEVVPYDHARVVLNELTNANGSDYINASSITDHDPRNPAYIATQGPLPHTAPDFWQLIWEQGAVVIVMLTRLTEGGNAMCHRYWPEEGSELYHIYEVHLVSEHIWCDDYLVRSFYLKNVRTGETRTVTQFHFLSWPETGIPASTKALLEFRRKVNKSYRGRSCPIVVHCSDGAGRTGTYCLIDMVLSRMAKGAKEIDIAATLEHLRDQRPRMVATKQQFEFVLTAVAEEVHAILKALPPQPSPAPVQEKEK